MNKVSSKQCPKCGNTNLVCMRTLNKKHCLACCLDIPWCLDKGQAALGYNKGNKNDNK